MAKAKEKLSVIVPTYEEQDNIKPLCTRLFKATRAANLDVELLLVDDYSGKGTEDSKKIVQDLQKEDYNIRIHVRHPHEGKGLSSAVLLGLEKAKNDVLLVMDADLQHEPESVPALAAPVLKGEAEFSVGSRNVAGGVVEDWPLKRRIISAVATGIARPLTSVSDPMSGFFCLSRDTLKRGEGKLNPLGYKIGLELVVRCKCSKVVEVPITFRDREAGESKLDAKQYIYYLLHLAHLYWFMYPFTIIFVFLNGLAVFYFFVLFIQENYL